MDANLDNIHTIEEITKNWEEIIKNNAKKNNSWSNFHFFFDGLKIKKIKHLEKKPSSELIPLGKSGELNLFFTKNFSNHRSLLKKIARSTIKTPFSIISIDNYLNIFSRFNQEEEVRVIKFPLEFIPKYFLGVLEKRQASSLIEVLKQLSDISNMEKAFITQLMREFRLNSTHSKNLLIIHTTIMLLCAECLKNDDFSDKLNDMCKNSNDYNFQDFMSVINSSIDGERKSELFFNCVEIIQDNGINNARIYIKVIRKFLKQFPFSLNEPSHIIRQVAITPYVLSLILENYSIPEINKKKKGVYYTKFSEVEFLSFLSLYRVLQAKLPNFDPNDLFKSIYSNWGFSSIDSPEILDQINSHITLRILDPACGSGIFLVSIFRLISFLSVHKEFSTFLTVELWGNDLDPLAIVTTKVRLELIKYYEESSIHVDYSNLDVSDFLITDYSKPFDLIIGNPPWVRHEDIGINGSRNYKRSIKNRMQEILGKDQVFDQKSDLYVYFCVQSLSLLSHREGVLAVLTSNAWLEVRYGQILQDYLLSYKTDIKIFEIISWKNKRLWEQLGINSVILIAEKNKMINNQPMGVFTQTEVGFSDIPTKSLKKGIINRKDYKDSYYRTEAITRDQLQSTKKWAGSFLRTSRNERLLIKKLQEGKPLSSLASVKFGIKTGANDFFHLKLIHPPPHNLILKVRNRVGFECEIERKYLFPLIKSPTEIEGFLLSANFIPKFWLFCCNQSLEKLNGTLALEYIKWAESEYVTIKQGLRIGKRVKSFSSIRSVQQREFWYSVGDYPVPDLLWTKSYHDRPGCFLNKAQITPDQRFYSIKVKDKRFIPLIFTYLNSSLVWAQIEAHGNTNMGYGVLDTNVYWLKSLKIPIDALKKEDELMELKNDLVQEDKRYSMREKSQLRLNIDEFYAPLFTLSKSDLIDLRSFISRAIENRIHKLEH